MIAEKEHVGDVWRQRGHEIRVRICDSGQGPRVDVREYITADAYKDSDSARARRAGGHVTSSAKGSKMRVTKARTEYVGPTKQGFWLTPDQAVALCELLATASVKAGTFEEVSA